MRILVINSGSSSIKYKVFDLPRSRKFIAKGLIEHIGEPGSAIQDHYSGVREILRKADGVDAIGHRVVHGGESFKQPVLIDAHVLRGIRRHCLIAPLHNPANLAGINACKRLLPGIAQVAVFDTAFHQSLPAYAYMYALPYRYYAKMGIRKYGFHGTSHQYVAAEAARTLKKPLSALRIITCHLGNGCSVAAVHRGKSIDTSMGFTPLEGLMMGTRCGDIDPALIGYIMQRSKLSVAEIDRILNKESGLKGISGTSNDMRTLLARSAQGDARARLSIQMFVYRIRKYIGAYTAVMDGCDALVFTAGIGENATPVRELIIKGAFDYLKKKPAILVIPTDEELMIALETCRAVTARPGEGKGRQC